MQSEIQKRGLFIVFEGIDRVGKSSQVKMLESALSKKLGEVILKAYPDRTTESGKLLSNYLKRGVALNKKAQHLLFSFNRWESNEEIKKSLLQNKTIISDRYAFSGIAYSLSGGITDLQYVLSPDKGLVRPDLVIQLDCNIDDISKREGYGDEIYEVDEFQRKVRENFKVFHKKIYWKIVNANRSKEEIHSEIMEIVDAIIKKYSEKKDSNQKENNAFPNDICEDLFEDDLV